MTVATIAPAGRDFGTDLLRTTVRPLPVGGYRWRRSVGTLAPTPFVPALDDVVVALPAPGPVRWVAGVPDGDARTYHVRGDHAVAGRLLRDGPDAALAPILHGLGRALRHLHDQPVPAGVGTHRPRGFTRLTTWLDGRSPQPRTAYAESLLLPRLGVDALRRIRAYTERIATAPAVLCHGAPGLGSLVPAEADPTEADALIGEDLCAAPWEYDLGWVLGELVELQWYRGGDRPAWQRLITALLDGYGRDLGDRWQEWVAFRVLLHIHDYTAYVGWESDVFARYTGFARYLLSS
ncbi:hypothetical protein AB0J14_31515 [Micromonospora arborensis]|uniref:hypothetical protein n=1 Tax=Micromonospora arborensis TaxID=2116518 RepID=UPI0033FDC886